MAQKSVKPFIRMTGISKSFGGVQALSDVDLTLYTGEVHALAGENGSGKTTLIKILSGVFQADSGTIEINGKSFKKISSLEAVRLGIQIIYQDFSIFPNLTVRENIAFSSEIMTGKKFVNKKRVNEIALSAMQKIGLTIDPDTRVELLSVADKQLVAMARALHHDAKLIVMDEPTTALTHNEVLRLFSIIESLKKRDVTILFVSHKTDEVFSITENYTILRSGKRVAHGSVATLTNQDFTYYMTGRKLEFKTMEREETGDVMLEVKNLGLKNCFTDVSFKLRKGSILAITGFLGSGRTEIAEALFGLKAADSGEIFIDGKRVKIQNVKDAMKNGIGYVPEDRLTEGLFLRRSIMDNAIITNIDKHSGSLGILNYPSASKEGEVWLKRMSLNTDKYKRLVSTLSGGNQQKVVLSRWLATEPRIFILNGPTVGVDIGAKYDLLEVLRGFSEEGMSIIIISDDIPEVMACSDRMIIMRSGRIIREFRTADVTEADVNAALNA